MVNVATLRKSGRFRTLKGMVIGSAVGTATYVAMSFCGILDGGVLDSIIAQCLDAMMGIAGIPGEQMFTVFPFEGQARWDIACFLIEPVYFVVPSFLAVIAFHVYRFRWPLDEHTRCGNCNQILRGLSIPRCPECGMSI